MHEEALRAAFDEQSILEAYKGYSFEEYQTQLRGVADGWLVARTKRRHFWCKAEGECLEYFSGEEWKTCWR